MVRCGDLIGKVICRSMVDNRYFETTNATRHAYNTVAVVPIQHTKMVLVEVYLGHQICKRFTVYSGYNDIARDQKNYVGCRGNRYIRCYSVTSEMFFPRHPTLQLNEMRDKHYIQPLTYRSKPTT